MARKRLTMKKIKEVIRLKYEAGLTAPSAWYSRGWFNWRRGNDRWRRRFDRLRINRFRECIPLARGWRCANGRPGVPRAHRDLKHRPRAGGLCARPVLRGGA